MCGSISFTFKKRECEENGIVDEERSPLQSKVLTVYVSSSEDSAETLTILRNAVATLVLRVFIGGDSKGKNGSLVDGSILLIERPNACVALVLYCLVEMETRGGYRQKHM